MMIKNIKKRPALIAIGVACLLIAVQIAIPSGVVMPRTHLGPEKVGWQRTEKVSSQLQAKSKTVPLLIDNEKVNFDAKEVGIYLQANATVDQLPTITLQDRFIPLKPLYKLTKKTTIQPAVAKDTAKIERFAQKISTDLSKEPVNARPEITANKLTIFKDKAGVSYSPATIRATLMQNNPFASKPVKLTPAKVPAKIQEKDVVPLKEVLASKTAQELTVTYGEFTKKVPPEELQSWIRVQQPDSGGYSLVLGPAAVDGKIQEWAKDFNRAAGITQVSYHDDIEVSRKTGAAGRALDVDAIKNQINAWYEKPTAEPVVLANFPVWPRVVASRTYSRSSAQLQAQINDWVSRHNGRYQIAIRELGGRGREASYNVAEQTVMASTYKPFLAFAAYKLAESGALDLGAGIAGADSIEHCIEIMIVHSNNECAVELGRNHVGWAKADKIIAAAGFEGIVLNNYDANDNLSGDKLVNAREQAKFLAQLSNNALMNGDNTGKLLSYMKRQVFREGIPAGSRGATVANKVGFLSNYLHDVGIVYGSKSTYALVIMSAGSSWANIEDLARAVYDFMNE